MYNNSNGSVEHGAANPSRKEKEPQTEIPEDGNVADGSSGSDKQAESECKDNLIAHEAEGEEEEKRETEQTEPTVSTEDFVAASEPTQDSEAVSEANPDSVAVSEPNDTTDPVQSQEEDKDGKEEAIIERTEETDADTPTKDGAKVKPKEEELLDESKEMEESAEDLEEEEEHEEEVPVAVQPKEKVALDLCRVCMETEQLSDIFQLEGAVRVSDMIMKLCTNIRITARDHLPHKICERCLGQVRILNEFKTRCEASDKELRKNLKRSANKSRRRTDVIVVNCPMSDSENDDEPVDDDEYQVSQSEVESEPATSDDSFSPPNKRKRTPKKRGRKSAQYKTPGRRGRPGRKPKHMAVESPSLMSPSLKRRPGRPPKNSKTPSLANIVYIEAPEDSSSSDEEGGQKKRRRRRGDNPCPKCDEVLPSQLALKQHLKSHPDDVYNCDRCTLWFKTQHALTNHVERHKKADKIRDDKRKERERRSDQRLREQQRSSDPDERKHAAQLLSASTEKKKKHEPVPASSGRDLFKCVAPLTSTYWSDSFSE